MGLPFIQSDDLYRSATHPEPECEAHLAQAEAQEAVKLPDGTQHRDSNIARNVSCKEAAQEVRAELEAAGKPFLRFKHQERVNSLAMQKYPEHVTEWMNFRLACEKRQEENLQAFKKKGAAAVAWAWGGLQSGLAWAADQVTVGNLMVAYRWMENGILETFRDIPNPAREQELPAIEFGPKGPPHVA